MEIKERPRSSVVSAKEFTGEYSEAWLQATLSSRSDARARVVSLNGNRGKHYRGHQGACQKAES